MGKWSRTKYYLSDLSPQLAIIRRHHPLEGQKLDVLCVDKTWVVVRLLTAHRRGFRDAGRTPTAIRVPILPGIHSFVWQDCESC
jgi:hypothetical protein